MCGIIGVFKQKEFISEKDVENATNALNTIKHRGPDCQILYSDDSVIMGHAKLSILDFSDKSNQPIETDKSVVILNGEIYNYKALIRDFGLDTDLLDAGVISRLYDRFGIDFIKYIEGDFAIGIYDKKSVKTYLIRDRLGVKQIVYRLLNNSLYFASEVKALFDFGVVTEPNINKIFNDLYMWFWDDKKETYFKDVYHVNPGTYIEISKNNISEHVYWDLKQSYDKKYTTEEIKDRLVHSTLTRLQGSAKYATLLSGGLDSSLLTSIVAKNTKSDIFAMTIQYDDSENNIDFDFAKTVVDKYPNIKHNKVLVSKKDISVPLLKKLTYHMEEVIWDKVYFSMFSNYKFASENGFRIVINGQGSDEVWLGYYYDFPFYSLKNIEPEYLTKHFSEQYLKDLSIYNKFYANTDYLLENAARCLNNFYTVFNNKDHLNSMAYWATKTYLQSNLMQEDRMSMANSVECRVPFTDHKFVEMAFALSGQEKIVNNIEKSPIKDIAVEYVPDGIIKRKKQAFVNPSDKYDLLAVQYLQEHIDEISSSEYMNKLFDKSLWIDIKSGNHKLPSELYWKISAIYHFLETFNFTKGGNQ
ncbi:MAG: asparagine synthase (glutamine-hydrolyzing) [Alphaproteobacteria bacterium]|nr:asparagine synthase (glutamine-hydrolyzing) [Alphaproteobacteria bacterium]